MVFSPDGEVLAIARGEKKFELWDTSSGNSREIESGWYVRQVQFSPGGHIVAVIGSPNQGTSNSLAIWDVSAAKFVLGPRVEGSVAHIAFSPDGATLAVARLDNKVDLWDAYSYGHIRAFTRDQEPNSQVAFSPDGLLLASGGGGARGIVDIWLAESGDSVYRFPSGVGPVRQVTFSPAGDQLASVAKDTRFRLWNDVSNAKPATGSAKPVRSGDVSVGSEVEFSPDGSLLAAGGPHNSARLWNTETGAVAMILNGHTGPVRWVAFSPDGRQIATASMDETVRVWAL